MTAFGVIARGWCFGVGPVCLVQAIRFYTKSSGR